MARQSEHRHRTHTMDPARSPGAAGPGGEISGGVAQPVSDGQPATRRAARWRWTVFDERGSATAELTLLTPLLIMLLLFVVFCGRVADTRLRINDAAHQAARAASLARSTSAAQADATSTAASALADAGVTCRSLSVTVDTAGLRAGSTVTATVTCTVGLSDLALLGVPGTTTESASFSSPVDVYRGLAEGGGG